MRRELRKDMKRPPEFQEHSESGPEGQEDEELEEIELVQVVSGRSRGDEGPPEPPAAAEDLQATAKSFAAAVQSSKLRL
jgi:hypothetical protein